jgi:hypothetical protein
MEEDDIFSIKYKFKKLSVILLIVSVVIVALTSYLVNLYENSLTCEDCLQKCQESYSLTIDNSWFACDERCYEKYEKEECNIK